MAFKIIENPEFTHPVTVHVPVDGGHTQETFRCRYRVVSAETLALHELHTAEGTEAYLRAICVRFEDVVDGEGKEVPHSDVLMTRMIGIPFIRQALVAAYTAAMSKARAGN
jgi:hypothetical protein